MSAIFEIAVAETDREPTPNDPPTRTSPSQPPRLAIHTRQLTKTHWSRNVVNGMNLEVPTGVVAGFVGPNGAGKTTTIRMLLALIQPTSGSVEVLGVPSSDPSRYLPQVGAMIEGPAFYP